MLEVQTDNLEADLARTSATQPIPPTRLNNATKIIRSVRENPQRAEELRNDEVGELDSIATFTAPAPSRKTGLQCLRAWRPQSNHQSRSSRVRICQSHPLLDDPKSRPAGVPVGK